VLGLEDERSISRELLHGRTTSSIVLRRMQTLSRSSMCAVWTRSRARPRTRRPSSGER
jgi:hypothetical protein